MEDSKDLISRQAAIDALGERPLAWTESEYETGLQNQWEADVDAIKAVPSAQPERVCIANITLTDEQVKEAFEEAKNAVISVIEPEQRWIPVAEKLPDKEDWYIISTDKLAWVAFWNGIEWSGGVVGVFLEDIIAWKPFPAPYRKEGETDG